ncbi:imelysin family protein, partial [Morganella morganii]
ARYCPLLEAIGTHQQQLAQDILARWKNDGGMLTQMSKFPNDRYADAHEAIAELLRVQVTALDMLKKKLGTPLGRQSKGIPQPYQAEAWRSNASLASLDASLSGAQALWEGIDGKGLKTLLPAEQKDLAGKIDAAYADSHAKLAALEQKPLSELLASEDGRNQLNALYDSLNVVHRLHEGDLARALGVQLGFNANDGD